MALFNESLEGRFARLVGALHSMKGPNPVPQVSPEISHIIQISDDIERHAHLFLEGTARFTSGLISVIGDATHFGVIQFVNPAASGTLCIVERLMLEMATNTVYVYSSGAPAALTPGSTGNSFPLDTRDSPSKQSVLQFISNGASQAGFSGTGQSRMRNPYTLSAVLEAADVRGLVLGPGGRLSIFSGAVNLTVTVATLIHRERAANPAELRVA